MNKIEPTMADMNQHRITKNWNWIESSSIYSSSSINYKLLRAYNSLLIYLDLFLDMD